MKEKQQEVRAKISSSQISDGQISDGRRNFLQGSAVTVAGVAVVSTGFSGQVMAAPQAKVAPLKHEGYRLTKHIMDYYKSAAR